MAEDAVIEVESSAASEVTQDEGSTEDQAHSSSAETDAPESTESLLDVVQNVLEDPKDGEEIQATDSSPTKDEPEDSQYEASDSDDDVELSKEDDEEYKDAPFSKHPRFRKLIAEKNRYREGAEQYDRIKNFMTVNDLKPDEVVEGFRIMSLMKNDPGEAYKALREKMGNLADTAGYRVPKDIKQRVDDGYIDEATAKELSRTRAELNRERGIRQQMQDNQQRISKQQTADTMKQSVREWEEKIMQQDPDYSFKQDEILDRVEAVVAREGRPANSEAGIRIMNDAYQTVTERHRQRSPAAKPLKSVQGGKLSGSPTPQPKSLLDVIEQELAEG